VRIKNTKKSWQDANEEQQPPGNLLIEDLKDDSGDDGGRGPTPCPGTLHHAHGLAAIGATDDFTDQHRSGRPFAAKAETLEPAHDQQLLEIVGESGEKRKDRKPDDHDHE
jgi:hypothetical protein